MIATIEKPRPMETTPQIFVFKTNVQNEADLLTLHMMLDNHPQIHQWSVDTDDIDCVLRVVTDSLTEDAIISIIRTVGFYCADLA